MYGDIFDALAIDIYFAIVFQTFQVLFAGHGPDI
jgi:hypothetical protein